MPYGIFRYEQLVQECYLISKNINTSYSDLLDVSLKEKDLMIRWLNEEAKRNEESIKKIKNKN